MIKGVIIGSFNPFHNAHMRQIKIGMQYFDSLDIYVGKRKKKNRLPYKLRVESVRKIIKSENLGDYVKLVDSQKATDLDGLLYDGTICGSDIVNAVVSDDLWIRNKYKTYFSTFLKIIVVNRENKPFNPMVYDILQDLILLDKVSPISSTQIRKDVYDGISVKDLIPEIVFQDVANNMHYFSCRP